MIEHVILCARMDCSSAAAIRVGDLAFCGTHYKQHTGWGA